MFVSGTDGSIPNRSPGKKLSEQGRYKDMAWSIQRHGVGVLKILWWANFRVEFSTKPPISEYIIWNNKNSKVDCKTIYYPFYV